MDYMEMPREVKGQYLVVKIGSGQYGIAVSCIDNIVRMQKIVRVPASQFYFKGVINLRGRVVPVMSIRRKMGLGDDIYTNASRIIILRLEQEEALGVVVDEVMDVVRFSPGEIGGQSQGLKDTKDIRERFIKGIGRKGGRIVSLFDIDSMIGEYE